MINSMTGFASGEQITARGELQWEVRTVNHRYLEAQFKLPEGFRALEADFRERVNARLKRGKLDATLQFRPVVPAGDALQLNNALAATVIARAKSLARDIDSAAGFSGLDILRWPGVVTEASIDTSELFEPAKILLDSTLDALCAARAREGARLHALLEERLQQIAALSAQVRVRMPEVLVAIRERTRERARALEVRIEEERLEQELVLLAQKMDVAEELDRLDAHIAEARATFTMEGAIGRRLDFLMQEFNREANTLGSKSADAETTRIAVDIKVLIEQLREQVQNVE